MTDLNKVYTRESVESTRLWIVPSKNLAFWERIVVVHSNGIGLLCQSLRAQRSGQTRNASSAEQSPNLLATPVAQQKQQHWPKQHWL